MATLVLFVLYIHLWFFLAIKLKRNDLADLAWALGFVFIAWAEGSAIVDRLDEFPRAAWILLLVSFWGIRLFAYLYQRNRHRPEDPRYRALREAWGEDVVLQSYFKVFIFQGFLLAVVASPIVLVLRSRTSAEFTLGDIEGLGIAVFGLVFETLADWQLLRFKKNPDSRGKLYTSGLWGLCRHPNYFGEILFWWGIALSAFFDSRAWWVFVSPLALTFLLTRVTGIPHVEKRYKGRKDYEKYAATTPALIPWWK